MSSVYKTTITLNPLHTIVLQPLSLAYIARQLDGQLMFCDPQTRDQTISRVSTDSRNLSQGDLFVALVGKQHNGHDFVTEARERGVSAAVISTNMTSIGMPCIQVKDTQEAYGQLAKINREFFTKPVIAITGSNGKTSVKHMLYQLLAQKQNIYASQGNYNNEIGVPFSLLQLNQKHQAAIFELGARKSGDIAYLSHLVKPNIAIITNIGEAHIEYFGDQPGIAKTKREIFNALQPQGTAVLPYDTPYYDLLSEQLAQKPLQQSGVQRINFSLSNDQADVYATDIKTNHKQKFHQEFTLFYRLPVSQAQNKKTQNTAKRETQSVHINLALLGRHNVYNFIAAAAAYLNLGFSPASLAASAPFIQPMAGRLEPIVLNHNTLMINDSYNASPTSVQAAIDVLADLNGYKNKVLILANMLELGDKTLAYHEHIGHYAAERTVDALFTLGDYACYSLEAFKKHLAESERHTSERVFKRQALAAATLNQLFDQIKQYMAQTQGKTVLLIKGSNSMKLGELVNRLEQDLK